MINPVLANVNDEIQTPAWLKPMTLSRNRIFRKRNSRRMEQQIIPHAGKKQARKFLLKKIILTL